MNTNQSNAISDGIQPDLGWEAATAVEANRGNFVAGFGVKQNDMNVPPIPNQPLNPARGRNICCTVPQAPAWEYKIGIIPVNSTTARKDAQEFFSKTWGLRGWIFVSENQGIFHFKRPKQ